AKVLGKSPGQSMRTHHAHPGPQKYADGWTPQYEWERPKKDRRENDISHACSACVVMREVLAAIGAEGVCADRRRVQSLLERHRGTPSPVARWPRSRVAKGRHNVPTGIIPSAETLLPPGRCLGLPRDLKSATKGSPAPP